ncbi:MAG: (4Fe-4S)-binding protein [Deltaproteobacteria bacterium]|nr:(4Fe-4S)-binding protein [Deltaproteobacteria bacterium]
MRIAIASGKGGTGKTTVAVNLAALLAGKGLKVQLADCDVEEPNAHFFLGLEWAEERSEFAEVPEIDTGLCQGESCLACVRECRFKSLIWMAGEVMVFPELCHSCGLCALVCPAKAVSWGQRELGQYRHGLGRGVHVHGGLLRIGEAMAPPLIHKVQAEALKNPSDVLILDSPPGTSCPVIASIEDADYVILVTEPTPFGQHDLRLAVELVRQLGLPFGVVVNRSGMGGDEALDVWLRDEAIKVLARIPHSMESAQKYSSGRLLIDEDDSLTSIFETIWDSVKTSAKGKEIRS